MNRPVRDQVWRPAAVASVLAVIAVALLRPAGLLAGDSSVPPGARAQTLAPIAAAPRGVSAAVAQTVDDSA